MAGKHFPHIYIFIIWSLKGTNGFKVLQFLVVTDKYFVSWFDSRPGPDMTTHVRYSRCKGTDCPVVPQSICQYLNIITLNERKCSTSECTEQPVITSRFCSKFSTISILLEIVDQHDFPRNFRKITILFEIFDNIKLGRNLRNIAILFEIVDQCRFWWSKFSKITILVEICGKKIRFWSNFWKISIFGRNF